MTGSVDIRADRDGDRARLALAGPFDLAHATAIAQAVERAESRLDVCQSIDVDLAHLERMDGAGAVQLARLLDRLDAAGRHTKIVEESNPGAARLIALYRGRLTKETSAGDSRVSVLARLGAATAQLPGTATAALEFSGEFAAAVPKALAHPHSVDWRAFPRLVQEIGADALLVTGAANLLVGIIIGFIGVSQLGRFGAIAFVPELVIITHLRELGPLVTAIVVAGRSGAGLASEIATMKVSEEIDALRSLGFDPVRWLVIPRCLALAAVLPLLTWVGDVLALIGGFLATMVLTDMPPRAYLVASANALTLGHLLTGLAKTPFLALTIGMIACGQGLATQGGAAAVGARTTTAVVLSIFGVIVVSALFTFFYATLGI